MSKSKKRERSDSESDRKKSKSKKEKKEKKDKKEKKKHKKDKKSGSDKKLTLQVLTKLSTDDYFLRIEEFRVWLKLLQNRSFESLSSTEARDLFGIFVAKWNDGELSEVFYNGIPSEMKESCTKTSFKWAIKLTDREQDELARTAEVVDSTTQLSDNRISESSLWNKRAAVQGADEIDSFCRPVVAPRPGDNTNKLALDDMRDLQNQTKAFEKKKIRENTSLLLDEVAPKPTGREALIDKQRTKGAMLHAASQAAEDGRDGLDVSEKVTMGGGDDFEAVKARMRRGAAMRDQKKNDRARELLEKEQDRNQNFLAQIGVDLSQGPIKIRPRNDG